MKPIKYSEDSEMIRIGMKNVRWYLSKTDVDMMKPISEYQDDITGIFKASDMVLKREEEGYYEYRIDGLIYLPVRYCC